MPPGRLNSEASPTPSAMPSLLLPARRSSVPRRVSGIGDGEATATTSASALLLTALEEEESAPGRPITAIVTWGRMRNLCCAAEACCWPADCARLCTAACGGEGAGAGTLMCEKARLGPGDAVDVGDGAGAATGDESEAGATGDEALGAVVVEATAADSVGEEGGSCAAAAGLEERPSKASMRSASGASRRRGGTCSGVTGSSLTRMSGP